jgi:hypothetical protein
LEEEEEEKEEEEEIVIQGNQTLLCPSLTPAVPMVRAANFAPAVTGQIEERTLRLLMWNMIYPKLPRVHISRAILL